MIYLAAIDALQAVNRSIGNAPPLAEYPTSVTTAHLPLILTWPGAAVIGPYQTSMPFEIDVIVEAIGQGDFNMVKQVCLEYMDKLAALYRKHLQQGAEPISYNPVVQVDPDSPLQMSAILPSPTNGAALNYPFMDCHGFKLNLSVQVVHLKQKPSPVFIAADD
ncbi:MAG: hypothetical protein KJ077_10505 [Anaerolineae bacterium]|nr:hypothetical protein [Anaerolineae bacterium]